MSDLSIDEFLDVIDGISGVDPKAKPQLVWIDLETTGLEDSDVILEFGMCVSDFEGRVIPNSVFRTVVREKSDHYNDRLASMDDVVVQMHSKSGLLDELDGDVASLRTTQALALQTLREFCHLAPEIGMLAGSSVHYDEGKMQRYMPRFTDYLYYRQINVSSIKELCKFYNPEIYARLGDNTRNEKRHRSLSDLADSIDEYLFYVDNFLWTAQSD